MTVFILMADTHDGCGIVGVYASFAAAEGRKAQLVDDREYLPETLDIYEWKVRS